MDFRLVGRRVLVTAASEGLGFATARAFALQGADVWMVSRSEDKLQKAREVIVSETGRMNVFTSSADVAQKSELNEVFSQVHAVWDGVDILINNAGGPKPGTFLEVAESDWERAFELTLLSVIRCTNYVLPHMRKQHWGRILNFTSSSMKQPIENLILSNTFRTAVAGLSKSLALEFAKDNILVNTLGPGRIATARVASLDEAAAGRSGRSVEDVKVASEANIPMGRYGTPEEFANTAVFLASDANGYVTGQSILVDGGLVKAL